MMHSTVTGTLLSWRDSFIRKKFKKLRRLLPCASFGPYVREEKMRLFNDFKQLDKIITSHCTTLLLLLNVYRSQFNVNDRFG